MWLLRLSKTSHANGSNSTRTSETNMTPDEIKLLKPLERIAKAIEGQNEALTLLATALLKQADPVRITVMHERDLLAHLAAKLISWNDEYPIKEAVRTASCLLDEVEVARQESVDEVPA